MDIDNFLQVMNVKNVPEKNIKNAIALRIMTDYINGIPLAVAIKRENIKYGTDFNYLKLINAVKDDGNLAHIWEMAKSISKDALKENLLEMAYIKAEDGSDMMIKFLLERMYPNEFGNKLQVEQHTYTSDAPPGFSGFIDVPIEDGTIIDDATPNGVTI